jgi:pimeloyl-ACP methyl ester carboxylesterase
MRFELNRRSLLGHAALVGAEATLGAAVVKLPGQTNMGPLKRIRAGLLEVGYYEYGPATGTAVLLLHGFPYDVHSYAEVAPLLAAKGYRAIVPYLRGHGSTRFLNAHTPRSGQQAAIGADLQAFLDALNIDRAVLAGYDWGGRAACVVAALYPDRCIGLVSVNGYLIQNIAKAAVPASPRVERGFWYQFYFTTERGRAGLTTHRSAIARIMWADNSPMWRFDEATFARSAAAFDNPDYVEVVIHSYRHRLGLADGAQAYRVMEEQLAQLPQICVPSITLDGTADGVVPATDGRSSAASFSGWREHRQVPSAGHNLPQEAPHAFVQAVHDVAAPRTYRT